ncbi:hypothetical protein GQ44DRAFT_603186 [Phaeosphaeriaceae sp. PMI808]|nr:hypothetical protein GQ44DRAFT_603186 [Phaeosphaeriaceae sp. PMI808]
MDDLSGLDWSQTTRKTSNSPAAFPPFRQSPTPQLSGRSTPLAGLSAQQSGLRASPAASSAFKPPPKPATSANDSFAGLVSLNSGKAPASNLSLQERQKQIQEEKLREEAEKRKQYDTTFGAADSKHWDTLGSRKSTPEPSFGAIRPATNLSGGQGLSRAINKPFAGLDTTSKRPVQTPLAEDDLLAAFNSAAPVDASSHFPPTSYGSGRSTPALSANISRHHTPLPQPFTQKAFVDDDDDDMFGLKQMARKPTPSTQPTQSNDGDDDILGLLGKPVSEFERNQESIEQVEEKPRKSRKPSPGPLNAHDKAVAELVDMGFPAERSAIALATTDSGLDVQAAVGWLLNQAHAEARQKTQARSQERSRRSPDQFEDRPRRNDSRPGTRKARETEPIPAWMKGEETRSRSGQRRQEEGGQEKDVSQLASDIGTSIFKSANSLWKTGRKQVQKAVADFQQDGDPNVPKWMRDAQAAEAAPQQARKQRAEVSATNEAMMLEGEGRPSKSSRSTPPRQIPPVSSSALNSSAAARQKGSEAFKRGDYTAAHTAYSTALSPLPQSHPVTIIVLCNRAVTNIKVGDPKAAIVDADAALAIIGISRGEGEKIATGSIEGEKDMKEFYGKALMRKAEALENMEKWGDAHKVWKEAVQNGVGGAISISGRNRCEKATAAGNKLPAAQRAPPARKPAVPKPSALSDLGGGGPVKDSEAVKRMKAANAAAERADDEKFALTDQVDAKLVSWKGTKSDNLRALLGSLDKVLWPEAGWNKVNMGDLVMPNKVKIVYMKAIAKVHPDKISQAATVEQRMISAAVFATLNEAWDKFKTDNNL